ncbi:MULTISPECIES: 4'-phosphopantetheinyl transferase family protein [unclassified Streptomyces]|uniref:4'-phosphopantetheinyl transferase family protein n=1 Tax=unclassified Streptomyces TaxID=2593676 RepID=UPI0001B559D5|nr:MULTISPECIES: 4'-phosphopantetheinyl transferase superfamily protein [unclassified Streptomyces]WEH30457.1 4'-phosphopantetheinyl transferase superfamily protein [Streptomyces sp. AM 3-1-1]
MIAAVLPEDISTAHHHGTDPHATLFPEEEPFVARAVAKRRAEYTTVRACARRALAALGRPPVPLLPGERGAPRWPAGIVGSMTHCPGYSAAAVAPAQRWRSLGIDAEENAPLPPGVLDMIALPADREALATLPPGGPSWDRVLFSAKESVYKAWFPLARRFLDFSEAELVLSEDGTFAARVLVPGPVRELGGRWAVGDGLVVTAVTVRA